MNKYKWDIKKIKTRYCHLKRLLNSPYLEEEKKSRIYKTLTSLSVVINNYYKRDVVDMFEYASYDKDKEKEYFNKDYLKFLVKLALNVNSNTEKDNMKRYSKMYLSINEIIDISLGFYKNLDFDLYIRAKNYCNKNNLIHFSKIRYKDFYDYFGMNCIDYLSEDNYSLINRNYSIRDAMVFNHEIGHVIDYKFIYGDKENDNYDGFDEVVTYTLDYLFFDYLDKIGFPKSEVDKLRKNKDLELSYLANNILKNLKNNIPRENGKITLDKIYDNTSMDVRSDMLELESFLMAKYLYEEIKKDKDLGIRKLKTFMANVIPKDKIPNFDYIGLNDSKILELSKKRPN